MTQRRVQRSFQELIVGLRDGVHMDYPTDDNFRESTQGEYKEGKEQDGDPRVFQAGKTSTFPFVSLSPVRAIPGYINVGIERVQSSPSFLGFR